MNGNIDGGPASADDLARPASAIAAHSLFRRLAESTAAALGTPVASLLAVLFVLIWAASGPLFHYSDSWELVINTVTSIVTFLMVFLLQNTQTRDAAAVHLKLNELLRAVREARTELVSLEKLPDAELARLQRQFETMVSTARVGETENP